MNTLNQKHLTEWATDPSGPVALVLRQAMLPVEGKDAVVFPPTYADIGYNSVTTPEGEIIVTIDSVGSQANRIEPIFKDNPNLTDQRIPKLVPQISITYNTKGSNTTRSVSIFDAGHRLGDAIIRCTELREDAHEAFEAMRIHGDATKIARLAPTSLVFGVWDSRDTQAKLPRLLQSVILAHDVTLLKRSAQYNPAIDYAETGTFTEEEKQKATTKDPKAQRGYVHVPAGQTQGGIIARGPITRTVTINLIALRHLRGEDSDLLRSYILGLTLVAATDDPDGFLRSGCLLVPDVGTPAQWEAVARSGMHTPVELNQDIALAFAEKQAQSFGINPLRIVAFDKQLAKDDLKKKS